MTEREKMLAGQLYDPSDEELSHLRKRAFQLVERFNRLQKEDAAAQREILQALLGSMGDHVTFRASVRFDYGCNTFVGDNCYFNFNAVFLDCAPIRIGSNVMAGPGTSFFTALHPLLAEERNARYRRNGPPVQFGIRQTDHHRRRRVAGRRCNCQRRRDHRPWRSDRGGQRSNPGYPAGRCRRRSALPSHPADYRSGPDDGLASAV